MWYYAEGEHQRGPVSDEDIGQLMQAGTVRPETLVWREGQAGWQPAIEVVPQHLRPDATGAPPPLPGEQPMERPEPSAYTPVDHTEMDETWASDHPFTFQDSIRHVLTKNYFNFKGRARRREFWWWVLAAIIGSFITSALDSVLFGTPSMETGMFNGLFTLAILAPSLGVSARRLHDIGRSGWWQLIGLVPLIGFIVMVYWTVQKSDPGPNEYGPE
ncbi:MAG: DUF805 domain-containing protein [Pseudomonadota bacterium]